MFDTPVTAGSAGAATAEDTYQFSLTSSDSEILTFATMYIQSNDLYYFTGTRGIKLFDDAGDPVTGGITVKVYLWDTGTEVNEEPGVGDNQAPHLPR